MNTVLPGHKTRALELYGKPIEDEEYAHRLHVELGNYYGTAGPKFIQHIIQLDNEVMIATHKDIHSRLKKSIQSLQGAIWVTLLP